MAPNKRTTPTKGRITVDIADIIKEMDGYPEKVGIDPDLWAGMTYPQKCLYLAKKGLAAAEQAMTDE
jgi:hypothetical protein